MIQLLCQYPVLHPQDQVGGIRDLRVVGDHYHAAALLVGQTPEDLHDDPGVFPVQVPRGFVRQEDGCARAQAPGNGHPLLFAAGEGGGEALIPVSKPFLPGPIKADHVSR